jgi:YHS domain-containing protein
MIRNFILAALAFVMGSLLVAQDKQPAKGAETASYVTKPELYPLDTCIVSGEKLDATALTFTVAGSTFKACCEKCKAKVEKDPATYAKKLEAGIIAAQLGHYPLTKCAVAGTKLGDMGKPVQLVLEGTLVQLCCSHCQEKAVAKAPAMATKVRDAAFEAQSKTYPLDTCLVGGEKLGKDAVSVMYGTTLVRFCCNDCIAKFEKSPTEYLAKLHPAKDGEKKPAAAKDGGK